MNCDSGRIMRKLLTAIQLDRPLSSSATLTCDASGSGYGAHLAIGHVRHFCSGVWNAVLNAFRVPRIES